MERTDYISEMKRSKDPFVSELYGELDKRLKYFKEESEIPRMKIKDGFPAAIIIVVFSLYMILTLI